MNATEPQEQPNRRNREQQAWRSSPEARALRIAEDAVKNAFADWQQLRQQVEQQIVREWELYPNAPVFESQRAFFTALNEEMERRTDIQEAWERLAAAVREQHHALCVWIEILGGEEDVETVSDRPSTGNCDG